MPVCAFGSDVAAASSPSAPCRRAPWEATEDALSSIADEMRIGRSDLIQIVLREWLGPNAYLPVRTIDEESETDGSAWVGLPRSRNYNSHASLANFFAWQPDFLCRCRQAPPTPPSCGAGSLPFPLNSSSAPLLSVCGYLFFLRIRFPQDRGAIEAHHRDDLANLVLGEACFLVPVC